MNLSRKTVYNHLDNIKNNLNLSRRHEFFMLITQDFYFHNSSLKFTTRDIDIFRLKLSGMTDNNVAKMLGITYSGVRRHRDRMVLRNGCKTMRELIGMFYQDNIKILYIRIMLGILRERYNSLKS